MNPRTTGILLLVALALGAFVWFYEIEGEEAREEAAAAEKRLFPGLEAEDVQWVQLGTRDGAQATLERGDEGWVLVEPVAFAADAFAADGIASNLADLGSESVLEDPQASEEYGLAEGARVIRFRAGDEEHVLRIGDTTPIGGGSYARVEGRDAVVTIPTFKATSFDKSLADLRERRIVALDTAAVERVEVGWPDGGVTLERVASGDPSPQGEGAAEDAEDAEDEETPAEDDRAWRVVEPIEGRADGEVVNDLISDLSFLRATGFVDDPSDEQLADLEAPDLTVRLTGGASESGPPLQWTLRIGPVYDGDKRLVQVEPPSDPARGESGRSDASGDPQPVPAKSPSLYTIAAERMNDFPRQLVGYRFKRLTDFRIGDAAQVDFFFHPASGDPVAITARRSEDGWSASPEPMTPGKVARMVSELSSLQAVDIVSEQGSPEELESLGLSPPRTILSVFGESEEGDEGDEGEEASLPRLAEIHLGRVEGSEWIAARSAGDPAIYRLGYELAEHVPVSLEALRNRFLSDEDEAPAPEDDAGTPLDFLNPREESP